MPRKKTIQFNNGKEKKDPRKKIVKRFAYYDENGVRKGKTFTAYSEAEMAMKIAAWNIDHTAAKKPSMTVLEAVEAYINVKEGVLSPSTIAAYKDMKRTHIEGSFLQDMDCKAIRDEDVQHLINDMAMKDLSKKTIKNCVSLLSAAEKMYARKTFVVTYGKEEKKELYCPSNEDIQTLLSWIRQHNQDSLERAVLLAAFGPLRRGEICALTADDIKGNTITINKAVVRNEFNQWEIRPPKTKSSYRTIEMPAFVMDKLKGIDGKLINYTPHSLGEAFREAVREAGLPHFRFHDLRHYAASIMNYNGISDKTIQARGGWATANVMKRVYQNKIDEETRRETEQVLTFFADKFG